MTTTRQKLIEAAIFAGDFEFARYVQTAKMTTSAMIRRLNFYNLR